MNDPHSFEVIIQVLEVVPTGPTPFHDCQGAAGTSIVRPVRVCVAFEPTQRAAAQQLQQTLLQRTAAELGVIFSGCDGPCGTGCWATTETSTSNLLVVLAGATPASPDMDTLVQQWKGQGLPVIPVVHESDDPQVVLPLGARRDVAIKYRHSPAEASDEVLESMMLVDELRRAFISYAWQDGFGLASEVFSALAQHRFEVYLDRFQTPPGTNFVERIEDELIDKLMVVLIESAEANRSKWVLHEIEVAKRRQLGLLAINIGNAPIHPRVPEVRRLRLPVFDPQAITTSVEEHYRRAILNLRERRLRSLRDALRAAGPAAVARAERDGFDVRAPRQYSILTCIRPAALGDARLVSQRVASTGAIPVITCPRPAHSRRRLDLNWLGNNTPVKIVPDGRLTTAANRIIGGHL
jgi:hypothetical protein